MRRIAQQKFSFDHRLANQFPVARILHIANAAVNQFGRTAGGAFGEVLRVEQHRGKTASSGINRNTGAGRTAADDEHIPDFVLFQLLKTAFSPRISLCVEVHSYCSHPLDRATARPHCVVKNSR